MDPSANPDQTGAGNDSLSPVSQPMDASQPLGPVPLQPADAAGVGVPPVVAAGAEIPPQPFGVQSNPYVQQAPATFAQQPVVPGYVVPGMTQPASAVGENPEKNYLLALAFSYLLGALGIDRFYLGYIGTGVVKLLTFGGFGIWHFIDLLLIAFGKRKEKGNPAPLEGYGKYHKSIKPVAIVLLVIDAVVVAGILVLVAFTVLFGAATARQNVNSGPVLTQSSTGSSFYSN